MHPNYGWLPEVSDVIINLPNQSLFLWACVLWICDHEMSVKLVDEAIHKRGDPRKGDDLKIMSNIVLRISKKIKKPWKVLNHDFSVIVRFMRLCKICFTKSRLPQIIRVFTSNTNIDHLLKLNWRRKQFLL